LGAVTIDAPPHALVDFAPHAIRAADIAVTGRAVYLSAHVRLVREEDVRFTLEPVDADPGRLLAAISERGELLNFWAFDPLRRVTDHASLYVGDSGVGRFVGVRVAERAIKLRPVFFRDVLPVVELDGLVRGFRFPQRPQQEKARGKDRHDYDRYEFRQPSHPLD
jgi:hypothetical protein